MAGHRARGGHRHCAPCAALAARQGLRHPTGKSFSDATRLFQLEAGAALQIRGWSARPGSRTFARQGRPFDSARSAGGLGHRGAFPYPRLSPLSRDGRRGRRHLRRVQRPARRRPLLHRGTAPQLFARHAHRDHDRLIHGKRRHVDFLRDRPCLQSCNKRDTAAELLLHGHPGNRCSDGSSRQPFQYRPARLSKTLSASSAAGGIPRCLRISRSRPRQYCVSGDSRGRKQSGIVVVPVIHAFYCDRGSADSEIRLHSVFLRIGSARRHLPADAGDRLGDRRAHIQPAHAVRLSVALSAELYSARYGRTFRRGREGADHGRRTDHRDGRELRALPGLHPCIDCRGPHGGRAQDKADLRFAPGTDSADASRAGGTCGDNTAHPHDGGQLFS